MPLTQPYQSAVDAINQSAVDAIKRTPLYQPVLIERNDPDEFKTFVDQRNARAATPTYHTRLGRLSGRNPAWGIGSAPARFGAF